MNLLDNKSWKYLFSEFACFQNVANILKNYPLFHIIKLKRKYFQNLHKSNMAAQIIAVIYFTSKHLPLKLNIDSTTLFMKKQLGLYGWAMYLV